LTTAASLNLLAPFAGRRRQAEEPGLGNYTPERARVGSPWLRVNTP